MPTVHRRRSTLSITSTHDPELDARTSPQNQSLFFSKLPLELRQMIYELAVGEEVIHLTRASKGKFGHFLCEEGNLGFAQGSGCSCRVLVGGNAGKRLGTWILGFLMICRRMYSEAISILYKSHTFSLLHITHLLYLPQRVPAPRLNTIRTLRLRWHIRALPYYRRTYSSTNTVSSKSKLAYPEDTQNWIRAWQIIASLSGLRELYVVLIDSARLWEEKWLRLEEELLQPVKLVIQPQWFELSLPYSASNVELDMGVSSCRLSKPAEPKGDGDEG
ncbi:hypothetical protein AOQ84DRAFT_314832 [Glonium stellatum]|uniref:DUF7730 domain-containing protein n=1 Tax=Glonium stellatum TaxID=574774 RepID=A0A8E2F5J2_9PEZI|nr:hypothetical protein AOQ84DRAFT_314832 [Glonium stellatum]